MIPYNATKDLSDVMTHTYRIMIALYAHMHKYLIVFKTPFIVFSVGEKLRWLILGSGPHDFFYFYMLIVWLKYPHVLET